MEYKEKILKELQKVKRVGINDLIDWLIKSDYFTAPASTKFHCGYKGGLAEHSYKVYRIYKKLFETFNINVDESSLIICGILHDVCKIDFYTTEKRNKKVDGKWVSVDQYVVEDHEPLGHGSKSIILLSRYIKLTDFETYSILWHMGRPSDFVESLSYEAAMEKIPTAVMLHIADNMSSKLFESTIKVKGVN